MKKKEQNSQVTDVSDRFSSDDENYTCGCLYKCNDCTRLDSNGESKRDYFERKDLDYWDE